MNKYTTKINATDILTKKIKLTAFTLQSTIADICTKNYTGKLFAT